ncbi:MAG: glycerate kinase [Clostridiales bacterium]|nr:glycerate kinase [Clostridiales bacterium]
MKTTIAIDSFKGSLSSLEAGTAAAEGIRRVYPDAELLVRPIADGGEGTVETLVAALGGERRCISASDPLGRSIECSYAICTIKNRKTAVIEMSAAAGITLISQSERNPLYTTTYGVGEMIRDAISLDVRDFLIGIGGSATNDGGAGMLSALGYELLDKYGKPIPNGAIGLESLAEIRTDNAIPEISECRFRVACDVKNPLCGENGCSAVFAPQKGADSDMITKMDAWLAHFAYLTKKVCPASDPTLAGSGAAGGLGFALRSYLGASLESGVELILDAIRLEDDIADSDIVITGEGRLDAQTVMGKAPIGVATLAKQYGKPCIAFSGCVGNGAGSCNSHGIDAFFPIMREVCTLDKALDKQYAYANLRDTAEQVFRVIKMK